MFRLLVLATIVASALGGVLPRGLLPVLDGRIVGGEETTIGKVPYQLSLRYLGTHRCGASIINENTALTAAHCVSGSNKMLLRCVAGSDFRNSGGESKYVNQIIVHEKYVASSAQNDIALMMLDGNWVYTPLIQPIALPKSSADVPSVGAKALLSGWGTVNEGANEIPVQIRWTEVNVISFEDCARAYKDFNPVVRGMLCAAVPGGGKDACQGDSGGPMVVGSTQVGVVSWGLGCAQADYPGVYADVAVYRDWIGSKTKI